MIISKIYGGLGNQMFQYAIGKSLSIENNLNFKIDVFKMEGYDLRDFSLNMLNISADLANKNEIEKYHKNKYIDYILRALFKKNFRLSNKFFEKDEFEYNEIDVDKKEVYLDGYWQSFKYFENIRETLIKEFTLKGNLNLKNKDVLKRINSTNSVSIHIRRGDYVNVSKNKSIYNVFGMEYYQKAIKYINQNIDDPYFFVFSDDINWCKENLILNNALYVDANLNSSFECDMILMSKCEHNIIANSTFSWWGAWLNQNSDKIVIAPKRWMSTIEYLDDLYPKEWIKL